MTNLFDIQWRMLIFIHFCHVIPNKVLPPPLPGWPQVMEILEVMENSWNFICSGKSHGKQALFEKVMTF